MNIHIYIYIYVFKNMEIPEWILLYLRCSVKVVTTTI